MRPCKFCGALTDSPDGLCSTGCREEFYGETNAALYQDERHALGTSEDETEEPEEEL